MVVSSVYGRRVLHVAVSNSGVEGGSHTHPYSVQTHSKVCRPPAVSEMEVGENVYNLMKRKHNEDTRTRILRRRTNRQLPTGRTNLQNTTVLHHVKMKARRWVASPMDRSTRKHNQ